MYKYFGRISVHIFFNRFKYKYIYTILPTEMPLLNVNVVLMPILYITRTHVVIISSFVTS